MWSRLGRILWSAVGRKLVFVPTAATGILYWLGELGLTGKTFPVTWLIYAAPLVIWLTGGLLKQAVSLQKKIDLDPVPDMSLQDAFQHTLLRSKRAIGTTPDDEHFYTDVESAIRDEARLGRLQIWARPIQTFPEGFRETLSPIDPVDWDHLKIDLPSCVYNSSESANISDYGASRTRYLEDARVNMLQIFNLWPYASWWERKRDPFYIRRAQWFEQERLGPPHTQEPPDNSVGNGEPKTNE